MVESSDFLEALLAQASGMSVGEDSVHALAVGQDGQTSWLVHGVMRPFFLFTKVICFHPERDSGVVRQFLGKHTDTVTFAVFAVI